jgi:hypothetical protein
VPLNAQRFGRTAWRWAALAPLLALPLAGWWLVERARATNPVWKVAAEQKAEQEALAEEAAFRSNFADRLRVERSNVEKLTENLNRGHDDALLVKLEEEQGRLSVLADALRAAGPYRGAAARRLQEGALEEVGRLQDQAGKAVKEARANVAREAARVALHKRQNQEFVTRFHRCTTQLGLSSLRVFDAAVPLLGQAPDAREAAVVRQVRDAIQQQRPALDELFAQLDKAVHYESVEAGNARDAALAYVSALRDLLESTDRRLATGAALDDALRVKEKTARERRKAWEDLFER